MVDIEVRERSMPSFEIISNQGVEEMDVNIKDMLSGMFGQQKKKRKMSVADAFEYLIQEEENKLLDMDQVTRVAVERAEQMVIICIDEIDKVAGGESGHGPDVSREGVQRDILPIIEGTTVNTRYGMIRTDHILFIAAGAFHVTKPSDLIPELQGRLPIRVELQSLKEEDFIRILTEPKNALIKQYVALLETEGVKLNITEDAVAAVARFATSVNEQTENIGARRLHTILALHLQGKSPIAPCGRNPPRHRQIGRLGRREVFPQCLHHSRGSRGKLSRRWPRALHRSHCAGRNQIASRRHRRIRCSNAGFEETRFRRFERRHAAGVSRSGSDHFRRRSRDRVSGRIELAR